jgi:hypothetical protein
MFRCRRHVGTAEIAESVTIDPPEGLTIDPPEDVTIDPPEDVAIDLPESKSCLNTMDTATAQSKIAIYASIYEIEFNSLITGFDTKARPTEYYYMISPIG